MHRAKQDAKRDVGKSPQSKTKTSLDNQQQMMQNTSCGLRRAPPPALRHANPRRLRLFVPTLPPPPPHAVPACPPASVFCVSFVVRSPFRGESEG